MAYDDIRLLDSSWENTEEDEWEIVQYLRHGGILFGDSLEGASPTQAHPDPHHLLISPAYPDRTPEAKVVYPWEPEFIGPHLPPDYGVSRCVQCNRSLPLGTTGETCSTQCQETIDRYREEVLTWMGIKQ